MSNLITESPFGDLFSGTNPGFIYCISQLPSSKWMIYSKGSLMKGCWQGCGQVVTDKKWYSSWLVRVECCYHPWLEDARGSHLLELGAEDVKKAIQQNMWLWGRNPATAKLWQERRQRMKSPDIPSLILSNLLLMPLIGQTQSEASWWSPRTAKTHKTKAGCRLESGSRGKNRTFSSMFIGWLWKPKKYTENESQYVNQLVWCSPWWACI